MLCNFLTQSTDIGGVVSVMALNCLFILMTQHGLEYPDFYDKLYALFEPSVFVAKHGSKFFLEDAPVTTTETSMEEKSSPESAKDCGENSDSFEEKPGIDHFKNEESDPKVANVMRCSLWGIDTQRHHYSPPVSRFVLSIETDLAAKKKSSEIAVKDFSSGSYATIFNDENRRRVKQVLWHSTNRLQHLCSQSWIFLVGHSNPRMRLLLLVKLIITKFIC